MNAILPPRGQSHHCRRCGITREAWVLSGFDDAGRMYCCRSCAEGWGCVCIKVVRPLSSPKVWIGPDRRLNTPRRAWKQERRAMFLRDNN